jgi:hypothetical protein
MNPSSQQFAPTLAHLTNFWPLQFIAQAGQGYEGIYRFVKEL